MVGILFLVGELGRLQVLVCFFCFETQFLIGKGLPLSLENRTDHQNCRHKINRLNVASA